MKEEQRLRRKYSVDTKILQLLILPVSVRQVSQKKRQCYRSRSTNCFFPLYYKVQFCKYWFSEIRVSEAKICLNWQETHFTWFF